MILVDCSFPHTKSLVAKVLLNKVNSTATGSLQLSKRDMALLIGTDWETVNSSLDCLQSEGVIKIERHRIIINMGLLEKLASAEI